jgi:hypothetical protein
MHSTDNMMYTYNIHLTITLVGDNNEYSQRNKGIAMQSMDSPRGSSWQSPQVRLGGS